MSGLTIESAVLSAKSWHSIGREDDALYWLVSAADQPGDARALIEAAELAARMGEPDLAVLFMERASMALRATRLGPTLKDWLAAARAPLAVVVEAVDSLIAGLRQVGRATQADTVLSDTHPNG